MKGKYAPRVNYVLVMVLIVRKRAKCLMDSSFINLKCVFDCVEVFLKYVVVIRSLLRTRS